MSDNAALVILGVIVIWAGWHIWCKYLDLDQPKSSDVPDTHCCACYQFDQFKDLIENVDLCQEDRDALVTIGCKPKHVCEEMKGECGDEIGNVSTDRTHES